MTTEDLPPFEASLDWLRAALTAAGRPDLACALTDELCSWGQVTRFLRDRVPADLHARGCAALIASGDGWSRPACEKRPDLHPFSAKAYYCYLYCLHIEDHEDVRAALIASGDVDACYCYCRDVDGRKDVRAVFDAASREVKS